MRGASLLCTCVLTMMQMLSSQSFSHMVKRKTFLPRLPVFHAFKSSKPRFWSWGDLVNSSDNEAKQSVGTGDSYSSNDSSLGRGGSGKVAQFGESTPKISPVLVLPLSRRPVFPGFFATHLVKDEKTLEAIIENHKRGDSYLGLFLQKDQEATALHEQQQVEGEQAAGAVSDGVITSLSQVHTTGTYAQIHNVVKTARVSLLITRSTSLHPDRLLRVPCHHHVMVHVFFCLLLLLQGGQLLLMAHRRIRLDEIVGGSNTSTTTATTASPGPAVGRVTFLKHSAVDSKSTTIQAYAAQVISAVRDLVKLDPAAREHIHEW